MTLGTFQCISRRCAFAFCCFYVHISARLFFILLFTFSSYPTIKFFFVLVFCSLSLRLKLIIFLFINTVIIIFTDILFVLYSSFYSLFIIIVFSIPSLRLPRSPHPLSFFFTLSPRILSALLSPSYDTVYSGYHGQSRRYNN